MNDKITVYSQVYNTRSYLKECIESVLKQQYSNFEYIIVDNGCTDGSDEIIREYSERDNRIKLISYDANQRGIMIPLLKQNASGKYITIIDSDDWWEPDYLGTMISFLEKNDLDLALTGTILYYDDDGTSRIMRKTEEPVIMSQKQFAADYPLYWSFPSTYWGNIMKTELFRKAPFPNEKLSYGADTINMLAYIDQCACIGIDNTALYHYRIRQNSISYNYDANRFRSNIVYYNSISGFLKKNDAYDADKQIWLKIVHANSIRMTAETLSKSSLQPREKINELKQIAEHPLTAEALTQDHEEVLRTREALLSILLNNAEDPESLSEIIGVLAPGCAPAVRPECKSLILLKTRIADAVASDDRDAFLAALLDMIGKNELTKKYDLYSIVRSLSSDKLLLKSIDDRKFLRKYGNVYLAVWRGQYGSALNMMTDLLQNGGKAEETFLQLYLNLAALLNRTDEFLYGKLCLAGYLLQCRKFDECRKALDDLEEMGVEDNGEILRIESELKKVGK